MSKFCLKDPQKHDFPAAADYLILLFDETEVTALLFIPGDWSMASST
mgnify:CR=1